MSFILTLINLNKTIKENKVYILVSEDIFQSTIDMVDLRDNGCHKPHSCIKEL